MLLKLIPPNAEPTIHFTIVFRDVPAHLPTPPAWTAQYNHLVVEDLEVPPKLISLDKAAGLITLIDEVVFDLGQRKVSCLFADGLTEEWEMGVTGNELSPLQEVITLVQESTHEDERERERVREREREKQLVLQMQKQAAEKQRSSSRFSSSGAQPAAKGKHKKQRSLFMQFVSSIINLSSPSSSASHAQQTFPELDSSQPLPIVMSNQRAKGLRRTARASLVDTFRRFVLPILHTRCVWSSQHGGFTYWILLSIKKRVEERLDEILREAGVDGQSIQPEPRLIETAFEATTMQVPASFSDSESESLPGLAEDDDDLETEADGSSLRTPSTTSHRHVFPPGSKSKSRPALSVETYRSDSPLSMRTTSTSESRSSSPISSPMGESPVPPSPSPPPVPPKPKRTLSALLSPDLYGEHTHLSNVLRKMEQLICFRETQARVTAEEHRARMDMLGVRGKRRAWSNGIRLPGSAIDCLGFSTPFRSSPLARFMWVLPLPSSEEEEDDEDDALEFQADEEGTESFQHEDADLLLRDEEERLFRPSISTVPAVAGFPVAPNATTRSRERKHCRAWQKERQVHFGDTDTTPFYDEPMPTRSPGTSGGVRRRRVAATSGTLPISRLFPVSEELERELEMEHGHDRADAMMLEEVDPMSVSRRIGGSGTRGKSRHGVARQDGEVDLEVGFGWAGDVPGADGDSSGKLSGRGLIPSTFAQTSEDDRFDDVHRRYYEEGYLFDDADEDYEGEDDSSAYPYPVSPSPSPPPYASVTIGLGRGSSPGAPPIAQRREAFDMERPQLLPRVRTRAPRIRVPFGFKLRRSTSPPLDEGQQASSEKDDLLGPSSLLCQPFEPSSSTCQHVNPVLETVGPRTQVVSPPPSPPRVTRSPARSPTKATGRLSPTNLPAGVDSNSEAEEVHIQSSLASGDGQDGEEFTLAMDVVASCTKLSSSSRRRRKVFGQLHVPSVKKRPSLDMIFGGGAGADGSVPLESGLAVASIGDQKPIEGLR